MSSRTQPVLPVDALLALRPWTDADVPAIVAAYADPDIQRWNLHTYDEDEAKSLVAKWNRSWINETSAHWAITKTSDDVAIGRVGLRTLDLAAGEGEISYWVAPPARGCGIASLATSTLSEWLLRSLGLHRLEIGHSIHNAASCRVATNAGFVLECTMKSALLHADGWHDMHWHARIRSEAASGPMDDPKFRVVQE
jgi:[ribosomal protein S5]-alanine N-acetyltransferase